MNIGINVKPKYEKVLSCLLVGIISIFLVFSFLNLWNYDFTVPLWYGDGDNIMLGTSIKRAMEWGELFDSKLLGAPFSATNYDFPLYADYLNVLYIKIFANITNSYALGINIAFILLFPITSIITYLVMKNMGIRNLFCIFGSLTFSFLPYRFLRKTTHFFLSMYAQIPLITLVIFWLITDENFFIMNKDFFKYKKNYYAILFLIITSFTGIYYAFFGVFFIIIAIIIKTVNKRNIKTLLSGIIIISIVCIPILLASIPNRVFIEKNGVNMESPIRSSSEAEVYGLKITQLLLPNQSHGIQALQNIQDKYSNAPLPNEGSEYLGLIGVMGFITLIVTLLINHNQVGKELLLFSRLNLFGVLLGTIGGFGSMFALLITPQIRAYNRISVYIAFLSITAVCLLLTKMYEKFNIPLGVTVLLIGIFMIGLREQAIVNKGGYNDIIFSYRSDEKFIKEIEGNVSDGAMIYQWVYQAYPETPPINAMGDYASARGYLHSDTLRWSYGDQKGRKSDIWNRYVASLDIEEKLEVIVLAGFEGIYIDTYAYTNDELSALTSRLSTILCIEPLVSDDGRLLFYTLNHYAADLKNQYTEEQWHSLQERNNNRVIASFANGFSEQESNDADIWRWCDKEGTMIIYNFSEEKQNLHFSSTVYSGYEENSKLKVEMEGVIYTCDINSSGTKIDFQINVNPGKNELKFSTSAPQVLAPSDPRSLYMRFGNIVLN